MIGRWAKARILLCGVVLAGLGAMVVRKSVQLQVREAPLLRDLAEKNYLKEIELAPRRGRVLDRHGAELASTVEFDSIFCNPRQLSRVPGAARKLAKALGADPKDVRRVLSQKRYFAWLRRFASPEVSAAVRALALPGVGIQKEPGRSYPHNSLAATVMGHASIDGRGLEGIELAYDEQLRGNALQVLGLRDSHGRELLMGGLIDTAATAGQDLVLTLDKYLTYVTEKALEGAVGKHGAKAGVAVVMDPRTGEILAMANLPTYDLNRPREAQERGARNRAITDEFEPGSTMKTFTFAAALEAGQVRPDRLIDCQGGRMLVGKIPIRDDHPKGIITEAEVFKHSSNIGTVKIARRIGREALHDALVRFGFGRKTGVGLPGERRGTLHPPKQWRDIGFATHAFGQGLTVTPLQLTAAFSAVASGGVYRPPRLTLRIVRPDGRTKALGPASGEPERRVISAEAARTLLRIMRGVTEKGGTATQAAIPGYPVAGKTGTAQKVDNGGYGDKRVSSFVGIVPADDPRLVIAVVIDEPSGRTAYGGVVAAPAFKEIAEAALRYLGVPPSLSLVAADRAEPARLEEEAAEGLGADLPPAAVEVLEPSEDLTEGETAAGSAEQTDLVQAPRFVGMSLGQAIRAARMSGVEMVPEGHGVAVAQSPGSALVPRGSVCHVSFRPGG